MMWIRRKEFERLQAEVRYLERLLTDCSGVLSGLKRVNVPTKDDYSYSDISLPLFCDQLVKVLGLIWQREQPAMLLKGKAK